MFQTNGIYVGHVGLDHLKIRSTNSERGCLKNHFLSLLPECNIVIDETVKTLTPRPRPKMAFVYQTITMKERFPQIHNESALGVIRNQYKSGSR